jgi:hypothetical protein
MEELRGYFSKQTSRMNYCARQNAGRTIGSGLGEGACKNLIGKRLKQTKARWIVANVEKMAVLCYSHYSDTLPAWQVRTGGVRPGQRRQGDADAQPQRCPEGIHPAALLLGLFLAGFLSLSSFSTILCLLFLFLPESLGALTSPWRSAGRRWPS